MFDGTMTLFVISLMSFLFVVGLLNSVYKHFNRHRLVLMDRLHTVSLHSYAERQSFFEKPLYERTIGFLAQTLVTYTGQAAPKRTRRLIEEKLEKAGRPRNIKANDFMVFEGILCFTVFLIGLFLFSSLALSLPGIILLTLPLCALAVYIPWFALARTASVRQRDIRRRLADIMDLLVVSVEAGLSFEMALTKVVEKFPGTVAREFQQSLREMQMGKPRKDALKDMAARVKLMEFTSLVNAIIQSEQLGIGLGNVLRMQSDLIREKRQQWIEEQAMKAPVKMVFPLVFFVFPSMFIVLLGPAALNIMKVFSGE